MSREDTDMLRKSWTELYSKTLPSLAKARDSAQPKWPVTLDHCFARIILDNTVGEGKSQWDRVIKKPAVKNMDTAQLQAAIELGEKIKKGEADLVELDKASLKARGKGEAKYKDGNTKTTKVKRQHSEDHEPRDEQSTPKKRKQSTISFQKAASEKDGANKPATSASSQRKADRSVASSDPVITDLLRKIDNHQGLTPYRKRLYSTLLSVPLGYYTTYAAMATYLESSARAVGNGMRNNPFAPDVPCHRVLAADGSIGGFHGQWGKDGAHADKKVKLLADEGVKFDSRGKVKGPVFTDLTDLSKGIDSAA